MLTMPFFYLSMTTASCISLASSMHVAGEQLTSPNKAQVPCCRFWPDRNAKHDVTPAHSLLFDLMTASLSMSRTWEVRRIRRVRKSCGRDMGEGESAIQGRKVTKTWCAYGGGEAGTRSSFLSRPCFVTSRTLGNGSC